MTYCAILRKYLLDKNPDALLWLVCYGLYCHAIDDIIDNENIPKGETRDQLMLKTFEFAEVIYSNHFYIENISRLRPLIKMASQAYMNAIQWEESKEIWKKQVSDGLRQLGNEVILAVIEIVGGLKDRWEAAELLRQVAWETHHLKDGTPV